MIVFSVLNASEWHIKTSRGTRRLWRSVHPLRGTAFLQLPFFQLWQIFPRIIFYVFSPEPAETAARGNLTPHSIFYDNRLSTQQPAGRASHNERCLAVDWKLIPVRSYFLSETEETLCPLVLECGLGYCQKTTFFFFFAETKQNPPAVSSIWSCWKEMYKPSNAAEEITVKQHEKRCLSTERRNWSTMEATTQCSTVLGICEVSFLVAF